MKRTALFLVLSCASLSGMEDLIEGLLPDAELYSRMQEFSASPQIEYEDFSESESAQRSPPVQARNEKTEKSLDDLSDKESKRFKYRYISPSATPEITNAPPCEILFERDNPLPKAMSIESESSLEPSGTPGYDFSKAPDKWCPICSKPLQYSADEEALARHILHTTCYGLLAQRIRCNECCLQSSTAGQTNQQNYAYICIVNRLKELIGSNILSYSPEKGSEVVADPHEARERALEKHPRQADDLGFQMFTCLLCEKRFNNATLYESHRALAPETHEHFEDCRITINTQYNHIMARMSSPQRRLPPIGQWYCNVCDGVFENRLNAINHIAYKSSSRSDVAHSKAIPIKV